LRIVTLKKKGKKATIYNFITGVFMRVNSIDHNFIQSITLIQIHSAQRSLQEITH